MVLAWVRDTLGAKYIVPAEWKTNGDHTRVALISGVARPLTKPISEASHLGLQAEAQAIRYRIDGNAATATVGFVLPAGSIAIIPCPNASISVFPVAAGAIIQFQWIW